MKYKIIIAVFALIIVSFFTSCNKNMKTMTGQKDFNPPIDERVNSYANAQIQADISHLNQRQIQMLQKLVEAGKIADAIFWKQSSVDGIAVRDSLIKLNKPQLKPFLDYVLINYGPYDVIHEGERFVGNGPAKKPDIANFYPQDMTKHEFENYITQNPTEKDALESQYTVVVRDGNKLKAIPYHQAYPEVEQLAKKLEEAAELCDHPQFKNYLILRAKALRTDDYYDSDMAWMDVKDSDVDVVIGPIENYEDMMFNYKTAFEAVVMVKDVEATKELDMFKAQIDNFEMLLPCDEKYKRKSAGGDNNQLNIVNVVYYGGDCQSGIKTIAASLPNDPKVREAKGGKNSMYKNMMEAKFDKIVVPIAEKILDPSLLNLVSKKSFISFVTLHEVSHTLGRGYVFGNDKLTVRKALKEKYSAIEETKADILGIYNQKHLMDIGKYTMPDIDKAIATYIAGLYRSIRFGAEEAHGVANIIQLNYLTETGAITKQKDGKFTFDQAVFMDRAGKLAKLILTIEAEGDYKKAGEVINKYGKMNEETKAIINSFKNIPRDLNTTYNF